MKSILISLFCWLCFIQPTHAAGVENYSQWKLNLPIDKDAGFNGVSQEIKPLSAPFEKAPYYFKNQLGFQVFRVPVEGATTKGSHYPRAELREMTGGKESVWKVKQGGVLQSCLSVDEVATTSKGTAGRVVIGQIHGSKNELCRLYYDRGQLYFYDDKAGSKKKETKFTLTNEAGNPSIIPLGESFCYEIKVAAGSLIVSANYGNKTFLASEKIGSYWKDDPLYFKAGVYSQVGKPGSDAGTTGTGWFQATFSQIKTWH